MNELLDELFDTVSGLLKTFGGSTSPWGWFWMGLRRFMGEAAETLAPPPITSVLVLEAGPGLIGHYLRVWSGFSWVWFGTGWTGSLIQPSGDSTSTVISQMSVSHDRLLPVQLQEEETEALSPAGIQFNIPKTLRYTHTHTCTHVRAPLVGTVQQRGAVTVWVGRKRNGRHCSSCFLVETLQE